MKFSIVPDEYTETPRSWYNLGTLAVWHEYLRNEETSLQSIDEFEEFAKSEKPIMLPVYLHDHSGASIRTRPFNCPWDSAQVGYIYVTRDRVRAELGVKRITKKVESRVKEILENEVITLNSWLNGEVYGYLIEDDAGNVVDSCFGFYGDDPHLNGMVDSIPDEYLYLVDC